MNVPKTVQIKGKYYREGVEIPAPKAKAKKVIPKKPEGLAGSDKVVQGLKERRNFFKNLAGR